MFHDRPLPDQVATAILSAGRRAQSLKNTQPWHFSAVRERATLQALSKLGTVAGPLAGVALGAVIATP